MSAEYSILHYAPGVWLPTSLDRVIRCAYGRSENEAGEMTLVLPDHYYDPSLFAPFSRFVIEVAQPGQAPHADLNTVWFLVDGPFYELDQDGSEVIVLECMDALGFVLSGHHIAADPGESMAEKLDQADDMCKVIVREQMGSSVTDSSRNLSAYLSVDVDVSSAPIVRLGFDRISVLEACQKIAQASAEDDTPVWLGFDVVLDNAQTGMLAFRTYTIQRGQDHRYPSGAAGPVVLSANNGTLSRVRSGWRFRESATVIYAAGQGIGDLRPIKTEQNDALIALSPFGRRELFVDTQAADAEDLTHEAKSALRRARPRRFLEAEINPVEGALRGVHWDWGDFVTAEHRNDMFPARIESIGVVLEPNQNGGLTDSVSVMLRGETNVELAE